MHEKEEKNDSRNKSKRGGERKANLNINPKDITTITKTNSRNKNPPVENQDTKIGNFKYKMPPSEGEKRIKLPNPNPLENPPLCHPTPSSRLRMRCVIWLTMPINDRKRDIMKQKTIRTEKRITIKYREPISERLQISPHFTSSSDFSPIHCNHDIHATKDKIPP